METIDLTCPAKAYDALVEAVHKAQGGRASRKGTRKVSVDVEALEALIVDHGRLLRAVPHKEPEQ